MQAINLNLLLEDLCNQESTPEDALEQLFDFSVKQSTVVALIRRHRHETGLVISLLKTFGPLLNFEEMRDDLYPLCAQAIDQGMFPELRKSMPPYFNFSPVELSKACGRAGVEYEKIPECLRSGSSYVDELIATDNLELFLSLDSRVKQLWHTMIAFGRNCAKRMMTHYMTPENLGYFLRGAFLVQNKETVSFLRDYQEEVKRTLFEFLKLTPNQGTFYFAERCIREGLVVLSENDWQLLKKTQLSLYNNLQNDV